MPRFTSKTQFGLFMFFTGFIACLLFLFMIYVTRVSTQAIVALVRGVQSESSSGFSYDPKPSLPASIPPPSAVLSAQDLKAGEQQVLRMIQDRPEMSKYVKPKDPIWNYCVRQFGGEAIGEPILWSRELPEDPGTDAEHQSPIGNEKGYILFRRYTASGEKKGEVRSGEEMWSDAIYELFNIQNTNEFDQLYQDAIKGKLSKEQWMKGNTRLEYIAYQKEVRFYETTWKPYLKAKGMVTRSYYWNTSLPDTYEAWIAQYTDPSGYPYNIWGKYYDEQVIPYLEAVRKQKAQ